MHFLIAARIIVKGWLVHGESPVFLLYRDTEGKMKKKKIHHLLHNPINFLLPKEEQGGQQAKACCSYEQNWQFLTSADGSS
jgi:hypothetical protein